ncbi:MAG TPA: hypothetical protein VH583_16850 [Vicinamibacterales bacterium]|jgi:hypothetical protein
MVNRRVPLEGLNDLKDERFIFQASLSIKADRPFVPRPNPRGHEHHDPDERIADLQYRDAMEFAVGHGTSVHAVMTGQECAAVQTTWMPQCEVERVEPAALKNVELGMEVLAAASDPATLRASLSSLVTEYGKWIEQQAAAAPKEKHRAEVAADLLDAARRAAKRINDGLSLFDDPLVLEAFRLANLAMALAARQRRSQETGKPPASCDAPAWRPFQLAFVLMNLRAFVTPTNSDRELVDLLFFPTGGGKTEAYLGLAAFVILLRRLGACRNINLSSASRVISSPIRLTALSTRCLSDRRGHRKTVRVCEAGVAAGRLRRSGPAVLSGQDSCVHAGTQTDCRYRGVRS